MKFNFKNLNWALVASDLFAIVTIISLIPYDKDTMQLVNQIIPATWIPGFIKTCAACTLFLRLTGRLIMPTPKQ